MTSPAMTMGRTGRKMVTQHGSLGRRALARNSSSDAIADEDVDSYADMVYELYGLPIWDRIQRKQFGSRNSLNLGLRTQD